MKPLWPLVLGTVLLTGCADVLNNLLGGATVSGTVKAPGAQLAGIFLGQAYRLMATLPGESAVKGATVRAFSSSGVSYGTSTTTSSTGTFELQDLPLNTPVIVEAQAGGKTGTLVLTALLKATAPTEVRDVNTASTVVAEKLRTMDAAALARLTQVEVDRMESLVAANLDTSLNGLDLTSPASAVRVFDALQAKTAALKDAYASITGTLTTAGL